MTGDRLRAGIGVLLALGLALVVPAFLFPHALSGQAILSANDIQTYAAPFTADRPASRTKPDNPLLGDPVYVFHPDLQQARKLVRGGHLPLWDPSQLGGRPLLASQQTAPLYPLTWAAYVLPFWASLAWIAAAKLAVGIVGMYLLARWLRLRRAAAAVSALGYGASPYLVVWVQHPHTNSYILLPWMMLAAGRLARSRRIADAAWLALAVGLALLGGHPQSAIIGLLPALAVLAFEALRRSEGVRPPLRSMASVMGLAVAACFVGVGVAAVALLPFAEALGDSDQLSRGTTPPSPVGLIAVIAPEWWGRPDDVVLGSGGPLNFPERGGYVGAITLGFAGLALLFARSARVWLFAGIALAGIILAVDIPVLTGIARDLPLLSRVDLNRAIVLVVFALAVLGGYGVQALLATPRPRRLTGAALLAALALLVLVLQLVDGASAPDLSRAIAQIPGMHDAEGDLATVRLAQALRWALLCGVAAAVLAITPGGWRRRVLPAVLVAAVAADLIAVGAGYHPQSPERVVDPPVPPVVQALQERAGESRAAATGPTLGPNLSGRYGLRDVRGHDHPILRRASSLFYRSGGVGARAPGDARMLLPEASADPLPVLDRFSVDVVLATAPLPGLTPVAGGPAGPLGERVYVNPTALPRAWFSTGWRESAGFEASIAATEASSTEELLKRPIVEGRLGAPAGTPRTAPVEVLEDDATRTVLKVDADAPGLLVLNDAFYPGWRVAVDGADAETMPVNTAFRGVHIAEAGRHRVEFAYRPASVRTGLLTSLASLLVLALAGMWTWRRRQH